MAKRNTTKPAEETFDAVWASMDQDLLQQGYDNTDVGGGSDDLPEGKFILKLVPGHKVRIANAKKKDAQPYPIIDLKFTISEADDSGLVNAEFTRTVFCSGKKDDDGKIKNYGAAEIKQIATLCFGTPTGSLQGDFDKIVAEGDGLEIEVNVKENKNGYMQYFWNQLVQAA